MNRQAEETKQAITIPNYVLRFCSGFNDGSSATMKIDPFVCDSTPLHIHTQETQHKCYQLQPACYANTGSRNCIINITKHFKHIGLPTIKNKQGMNAHGLGKMSLS